MDPRSRLGLLGCASVLALSLERPAALAALCLACVVPVVAMRVGWRWWARGAAVVAAIVWSTVLSQSLFYDELPRVPLLRVGPFTFWREGVSWGLVQSLRLVAMSLAGLAVSVATPADRLFAGMLRLRVPFGLAFLAVTALRFVPDVGQELLTVRRARARRGRPAHHRSPAAWLRLEISMLRPVVARSLRRARSLAESLDSRGFDASAPRAVRRPLQMARWEPPILLISAGFTASVAVLRLLYIAYTTDTLYVPHLRGLYGFTRAWL